MKQIIKLLFIIAWMGIIFSFSSDNASISTKKSDGIIIETVEFFLGRTLNDSEKEKWTNYLVVPVRKGAHLFLYFVLGILMINFLNNNHNITYKLIFLSIFLSFLYACSDEIHQLFVPGRSGELSDVLLDTFGSFIGILVYRFIHNIIKGREKYE